ncbi:FAD-dependent oxidoreductase [Plantactinospora sp. CA-294935]|uniref:FAD-dependent oxidoreductase n=1 Tax=Plantactinospora sp. CA-294935 TaxID=3240012 RepID=UPI003D94C2CE
MSELRTGILIVGGGLGGVAAALAVARCGHRAILTEPTRWLGGQLTSQAVPPDEHPWIEQFGATASYRSLRDGIREYYRRWYPLSAQARAARHLNPGRGSVSVLCHEPTVALAVIEAMMAPHRAAGTVQVLNAHRPIAATVDADRVSSVRFVDEATGHEVDIHADYVLDATETGDLLPLAGVEYVTGAEPAGETGEPHAAADAEPQRMQGFTVCFAMDHRTGEDHTIDRPADYDRWRAADAPVRPAQQIGWPNPEPGHGVLRPNPDAASDEKVIVSASHTGRFAPPTGWSPIADLWRFRRLLCRHNLTPSPPSDITLVNWSANDYHGGSIVDVPATLAAANLRAARQLSLSLFYWLQTEAPRADGGTGFPGLRLRPDVTGTPDGLAMAPYIRESRRIRAVTTIREHDIAVADRGEHGAVRHADSVGIGSYKIDLHPGTHGGVRMYAAAHPFEIPLGALLPVRMRNLLPAAKNIGTTHITNGCYRVHPVEWNIGEAAGHLAAYCLGHGTEPHQVREEPRHLGTFQSILTSHGIELRWPEVRGY